MTCYNYTARKGDVGKLTYCNGCKVDGSMHPDTIPPTVTLLYNPTDGYAYCRYCFPDTDLKRMSLKVDDMASDVAALEYTYVLQAGHVDAIEFSCMALHYNLRSYKALLALSVAVALVSAIGIIVIIARMYA